MAFDFRYRRMKMMMLILILAIVCVIILGFMLLCCFAAYRKVFYFPLPRPKGNIMPDTEQYWPYKREILTLLNQAMDMQYEKVYIKSYDGLLLFGKYYHMCDHAPVQIMFHGYKSPCAERDFEGAMQICRKLGHNFLLVDQRSQGRSQGHVITFGIRERYDCLSWIEYIRDRFGKDVPITLFGVSMGAATVLMSESLQLPDNVKGIIADCSYTSPKAIIQKVIADMGLPKQSYFFVKAAASLFAHFNLEECGAVDAVKNGKIPILLFHGENDLYVPCSMSREIYNNCEAEKQILMVKGAGHGMSFHVDRADYIRLTENFLIKKTGKGKYMQKSDCRK